MKEYLVLSIVISFLCVCPVYSIQVEIKTKKANIERFENDSSNFKVINGVLDKIEDGVIYLKDGRKFLIPSKTEIINNSQRNSKIKPVELIFKNNRLLRIIIK